MRRRGFGLIAVAALVALGTLFVAVGLDTNLLVRATTDLAAHFKDGAKGAPNGGTY